MRVEQLQLKESISLSGLRPVTLTTTQIGLLGLQPDPCNPEQVFQPLNLTVRCCTSSPQMLSRGVSSEALETGFWVLGSGYWVLGSEFWILDTGF